MDEERVKQIVSDMRFDSGKGDMAIDEIAVIQPGLARIMPEVGTRAWKLYYAAKAENWPNAMYQWKEAKKLLELGAYTRPKYEESIEEYLRDDWAPIEAAIKDKNLEKFLAAFDASVDSANAWHEQKDKPYIRWKVPDQPPPDLDLTPRK
ncbi:MAG: hypothetical protein V3R91_10545 [Myxococcota bacterium]